MKRVRAQTGQSSIGKRPQGVRKSTPRKRGRLREQPATKRTGYNRPSRSTTSQASSDQHLPTPVQNIGRKRKQSIENMLEASPDPDPDPNREVSVKRKGRKPLPAVANPPKHTSDERSRKRQRTSLGEQDPPHHSLRSAGNSPPLFRPSAHRLEPPALPASPAPVPAPEEAARRLYQEIFGKEMDSTTRLQRLYEGYDPAARRLFVKRASLSRKRSGSNSSTSTSLPPPSIPSPYTTMTPSDQRPREEKSAPYRGTRYPSVLQAMGSYMCKSSLGITDKSRNFCKTLLDTEQPAPKNSLFDGDIFEKFICVKLLDKNEARVIQDISRLIVPLAEQYALYAKHLEYFDLTESVNKGWNSSFPLTGIVRPQPDYSIGFGREAFHKEQLNKLWPFVGNSLPGDQSFFIATHYIMTLAVRAIVELFHLVKRENEKDTEYYQHPIYQFCFTALEGKEKWTVYRFIKNVYDIWVPDHFKKICSVINQLLVPDSGVSPLSEAPGLSQNLGNLMQSEQPTATSS
ncbi:hypothetical protein QBC32DRAFT_394188 [Pseudoneurospora amorphoporcata]|uniref:DUF7924 domain-containing protein n=1 Tax=Pseudoneurospora amorphoporcata TaxID=241081 RepID=A0AAN6SKV4_9PEZI|nr:hypothetical protein QBC32DRAFT_394188 [Pseudoneurospora amorphoporcata]